MFKYEVCWRCQGEGYVSKLGAFTGDDLDEWYGDGDERYEFVAEYTKRGGAYDEACPECKGQRVVRTFESLTPDEQAEILAEREYAAERAAEARYCGYY